VLPSWSFNSSQFANASQYVNGAPEDKIGDRYPFLEPKVQSQRVRGHSTAARHHKQMKSKV
jgi:hypothetical protein